MSSRVSGGWQATAAAPADIVKTRLMADSERRYGGFFDCLSKSLRQGGMASLYRGWTPSALRLAPKMMVLRASPSGIEEGFCSASAQNLGSSSKHAGEDRDFHP